MAVAAAAPRMLSPTSANVAGVATLGAKMSKARSLGWVGAAVMAASLAAAFIPWGGFLVTGGLDAWRNSKVANRQKEVLAKHYKNQVATTLGMDPNHVSVTDLNLAAQVNPMVAGAIAKVNDEHKNANRATALTTAAIGTTGAMGLGFVPKIAADIGGVVAASVVSSAFNKDVLTVQDLMEHVDAKLHANEPVVANDVLMLRIAQSEQLQQQMKNAYGVAFHKMNAAQQQAVIAGLPSGLYAEATEAASRVNNGKMQAQDLLMPLQMPPASWAERVGGQRSATTSFVDAHQARVAAAQAQPQVG